MLRLGVLAASLLVPASIAAQGSRAGNRGLRRDCHWARSASAALYASGARRAARHCQPDVSTCEIPSWFFGDGASLLNGATATGGHRRITLSTRSSRRPAPVRWEPSWCPLRRSLSARTSVEMVSRIDALASDRPRLRPRRRSRRFARPSRRPSPGLLRTWSVLRRGGGRDRHERHERAPGRDTALTVALSARFKPWGCVRAIRHLRRRGDCRQRQHAVRVTRVAYRFSILGEIPIDETDRVSLRVIARHGDRRGAGRRAAARPVRPVGSSRRCPLLMGPDTTPPP